MTRGLQLRRRSLEAVKQNTLHGDLLVAVPIDHVRAGHDRIQLRTARV